MYAKTILLAVLTATVTAFPTLSLDSISSSLSPRQAAPADHPFLPPGPGDVRSPCPMLNALANHGYLPRDGRAIDMPILVAGLKAGVNLAPDATEFAGSKGLEAGDGTRFDLDELAKHGILEHDGSLSRQDVALGDNKDLNPAIWAQTLARFPDAEIGIRQAARARKQRHADAKKANPSFSLSLQEQTNSFIESALYQRVFGKGVDGGARRDWIRTLFEEERLPFEQGWSRSDKELSTAEILVIVGKLAAVSPFV